MSTHFEEIEKQSIDAEAERLWIEEAQRRYDAYKQGEIAAIPGDEVMQRARSHVAVVELSQG